MTASLLILKHMVENAGRVSPWPAYLLTEELGIKKGTVYNATRILVVTGLLKKVRGGVVLSDSILCAGAKFSSSVNSTTNFKKLQEELYG